MVRTRRWKYVHFLDGSDGQLFDLESDPFEETNLWHSADHADCRRDMHDRLTTWRLQSGYETREWTERWR